MTMGEGGAVYTDDPLLKRLVESFRDWGRECWCPSGKDNTCGNRFGQQFAELPFGYDQKYVYSHFGYNLKATDLQAAIGCAQLEKLPGFIAARNRNWQRLRDGVAGLADRLLLPEATANAERSWFGFLITVRGLVAARLLGPGGYGDWNAIMLVMDYGTYAPSGTYQGLDQGVPARIVDGDARRLDRLEGAADFSREGRGGV